MENYLKNRSWAEVDLAALADNIRLLRNKVRNDAEIMGVVKADAYGHGIEKVTNVLLENGVTRLAVSMLDEAIELRRRGVTVPILVLGFTDPRRANEIIDNKVTQTVFSYDLAKALSDAGVAKNCKVRIHIKVDTGMGRVGFFAGYEAVKTISEIGNLPNIVIEGIYTHFSSADEVDDSYTKMQFEIFMSICSELGRIGFHIPIKHCCNSAAALRFPYMHLDMIRAGIIMYGLTPSEYMGSMTEGFKAIMSLKANVVLVKKVPRDTAISYGRKFVTKKESTIATVPIGYADGYQRILSGKADVVIHGRRFPIVGNICMDNLMVDVTDYDKEIKVGDEVLLFGPGEVTADELAGLSGTINYEITCLVGRRVPRFYTGDGFVSDFVKNYLI